MRRTTVGRFALAAAMGLGALVPSAALGASPGANGAIGSSVGNTFPAREKNLFEIRPDGLGRVQVTGLAEVVNDLAPVFSPDGNSVAFGRCGAFGGGCQNSIPVYIAASDGTGARYLTTSYDGTATWSPDGSKLAVVDNEPAQGIYVVNADGTGRHLLIKGSTGGTGSPTWSPDGTKIAFFDGPFESQPLGAVGLYLVDVAGDVNDESRKHLLLERDVMGTGAGACNHFDGYEFDWSPDGSKLLYHCTEPDNGMGSSNQDIATVDATSGATARIVATPGSVLTETAIEWFPRWSPDGKNVVYEREGQVWIATTAGAGQHALTPGYRPSWQPCVAATVRCGPPPAPVTPPAGGGSTTTPGTGATVMTDACPKADGPASNNGCPLNKFTFGTVRPTHRGTVVPVKVPGPGTVSIAATKRIRGAKTHASKAGTVKLTLKLSAAGRKTLGSKSSVTVPVKVTYKPDGGVASTTKSRIKFIK